MDHDAFDFVQHQFHTVSYAIENQFQTVSSNVENHLQTIRANIELHCSSSKWGGTNPRFLNPENRNIESVYLKSSVCSLDLNFSEQKISELVVEENKIIQLKAPKSPILVSGNSAGEGPDDSKLADFEDENILSSRKGLENTSTIVVDSIEEDSKLHYLENENIEPTAQGNSVLFPEIKSLKGHDEVDIYFLLPDDLYSDDLSFDDEYLEEFNDRKYIQNIDDSDSESFKDGRFIQEDIKEVEFENIFAVDKKLCSLCFIEKDVEEPSSDNKICSLCLTKSKSGSNKKITSESYVAKTEIIDEQECEQPVPNREIRNFDLNLVEDESSDLETADFDFCYSDWEVIHIN